MATQHTNAWQTARPRQNNQNSRSSTSSPQPSTISQPPRSDRTTPSSNVWAQRPNQSKEKAKAAGGGQHSPKLQDAADQLHTPSNGFNSTEVRAFLSRAQTVPPAIYKPTEAKAANTKAGSNVLSGEQGQMANGQAFFATLAKQVVSLENGG